jgi:hypothetical protein
MGVRQQLNLAGRTALISRASGEMARACTGLQGEGIAASGLHCELRRANTIAVDGGITVV